jgi:hypothetical protein
MKNPISYLIFMLFLTSSCVKNSPIEEPKLDTLANAKNPIVDVFPKVIYDLSLLSKCMEFNDVPLMSVMAKQEYDEISYLDELSLLNIDHSPDVDVFNSLVRNNLNYFYTKV